MGRGTVLNADEDVLFGFWHSSELDETIRDCAADTDRDKSGPDAFWGSRPEPRAAQPPAVTSTGSGYDAAMPASRRWTAAAVLTSLCLVPRAAAQGTRPALEPSAVRALVEHAFQAFKPVGLAFALVQGDQVTLELGLGRRKVGGNAAITPHSLFNIASCTKAFTALCIAKLVTEGKLNWDDRVVDLVPEFRLADPWITHEFRIRDLLCHRSGLKTFAGDLLWYGTDYDDAAVLARLDRLPITERFREQFGYQNLMYLVAGSVIERISGLTWSEYLRQTVLSPLGMSET